MRLPSLLRMGTLAGSQQQLVLSSALGQPVTPLFPLNWRINFHGSSQKAERANPA
jgi:hypothetical protein